VKPYGIRYGIKKFDEVTIGIQPHELVTISGWTGTGKSTLMQKLLFEAYLQGKRALMFSLEIDQATLMRRWETMALNVSYEDFRRMELDPSHIERWRKLANQAEQASNTLGADLMVIDRAVGQVSVDTIYSEIVRRKPDIVGVDYITLMAAPSDVDSRAPEWQRVQATTRGLKSVAKGLNVPIIAAAQSNRAAAKEGATTDNIGASISIIQDSDVALGLDPSDFDETNRKMRVRMLKNRDGNPCEAELLWDLRHMRIKEWDDKYSMMNPLTQATPQQP
jgi:replicative DNA helicase